MSVSREELDRIAAYGLQKHLAAVDGYIFSGHGIDDLTIRHFIVQTDIVAILHAYGYSAGAGFGDEGDSRGRYQGTPFSLVEEYISGHFPGFCSDEPGEADMTMERYFDARRPDWRNAAEERKTTMMSRHLSKEERDIVNGRKNI